MIRLKVREVAEGKGFSMQKLSRISDLSYNTVQTLWKEPYKGFSSNTLEKVAKALGVSMTDLFEELPNDTPEEPSGNV